jgi:hypothetical protein
MLRAVFLGSKKESESACERMLSDASLTVRRQKDDGQALAIIDKMVRGNRDAAKEVRERLAQGAPSYAGDRALRLFDAALSGSGEIAPPDPQWAGLYEEEEGLARMPIREALAVLCEREPELERISTRMAEFFAERVRESDKSEREVAQGDAMMRARRLARSEITEIVGPRSKQADGLLRSYIARNIAFRAVELTSGNLRRVDPDAPYFELASAVEAREQAEP